jgi:hypothetical protein
VFSMGSIIARFLESVLSLETRRYPHNYFSDHRDHRTRLRPPTVSLLLTKKAEGYRVGSSSFSTAISLQRNASPKRTTFHALGSGMYLGPKSHGTQALSRIRSCVSRSSSRSACLHIDTPLEKPFRPSTQPTTSSLALATFPLFPLSWQMKGHDGLCPCRMCGHFAWPELAKQDALLYVPLSRRNHPAPTDCRRVSFVRENLPLR